MSSLLPSIRSYARPLCGAVLFAMVLLLTSGLRNFGSSPGANSLTKYYSTLSELAVPPFDDIKRYSPDAATKDGHPLFTFFSLSAVTVSSWLTIPRTCLVNLGARNCFYTFITVNAP